MNKPQLGFIGLGTMGSRIVKRWLDAGYPVTGYNRTRAKAEALLAAGMQWGESPCAVAKTADITFSMVSSDTAAQTVAVGEDGALAGLGTGKIYVEMSTISPQTVRQLAARAAEKGAAMLDAPVSGSVSTVEQGQLSIMVGGDESAFEQVRPILGELGPTVSYMGPSGMAVTMKIAINLTLPVQLMAMYEGVLLAEKAGIPRETAMRTLVNSAVASPAMKYRGPMALDLPDQAWFDVDMMLKDMRLALELAQSCEMPLPSAALAKEVLVSAKSMGLGKEDFAAMFNVLARMANVA